MPKVCYAEKRFTDVQVQMIHQANEIIEKYQDAGYQLTLRQLYYQFVAHDHFPDEMKWTQIPATGKWVRDPNGTKNAEPNYKWLGDLISDGRMAGHVDWSAIIDRTRTLERNSHWTGPKDALLGVVEDTCKELDVPYFSCRGYTSQSAMWEAAMRYKKIILVERKPIVVLHFGDHDPSGMDMSRDIEEWIKNFLNTHIDEGGEHFALARMALNMDQVEQYNPPPNPAKVTDSRARKYIEKYGDESWELDALDPLVMTDLIREGVSDARDEKKWKAALKREAGFKKILTKAAKAMP